MRLDFCVACGSSEGLEQHHLEPQSSGGSDEEDNLITLCFSCHGKVHGIVRKNLGELTRQGLARARERGVVLGGDRGGKFSDKSRIASLKVRKDRAVIFNREVFDVIQSIEDYQKMSLRQIASELNNRNIKTPRGNAWQPTQVMRVISNRVT